MKLGDVAEIVAGFAFPEIHQGRICLPTPFIKVSDFAAAKDSWVSTAANTIDDLLLKAMRAKLYPPGTIIFPKVGGALLTNKRARLAVSATFDNNVMGLIPRNVDGDYLYWFMRQFDMGRLANTQALPSVRSSDVAQIDIPTPSFAEQRQIAARLKAQLAEVETARQAAQAQVRDAELLRQRLLRQPFDALHDAPHKVLGECAKTTSGSTPSRGDKRYWSSADIPWVKTGEVAFAPITITEESISRQALAERSLTLLPPQTVLIAMYGQGKTRGQSAILEIEATINQACFAIFPNDTWDANFLHHWLMASYEDLRKLSEGRGGNQANLNGALLNALEIPAPSLDEQHRITVRLKSQLAEADAIAQAAAVQLAEIERLPQLILAQAFNSAYD
jgi:type I restriction enzyme S subunit